MKRFFLISQFIILLFVVLVITSCKESTPPKKELWAVVIDFFSPDTTYYPDMKNFPFPDSLKFQTLESFFTNQNQTPVINDSIIIFYDNYRVNGQKRCCIADTLEMFIDSINGKKYLFAIGEYISAFQSDNNSDTNLRIRKDISIPLWGINLNTPYPPERFKNKYEKLGTRFVNIDPQIDEVSRQTWNDNDSILVETIQFNNSNDRIITAAYKEMNRNEVDSTIVLLKNLFPSLTYQEASPASSEGRQLKIIRMYFQGIAVSITQNTDTEYSFMITDYYQTLKLIMKNAGIKYIFREDIKIY